MEPADVFLDHKIWVMVAFYHVEILEGVNCKEKKSNIGILRVLTNG